MIVQHEILAALPSAEYDEFFRLDKRKKRTPAQDERIKELRSLATRLHREQREAEDAEIAANIAAEMEDDLRRASASGMPPSTAS